MYKVTDSDIVELLKRNSKCNFVAHAITPWHANGVEASINYFENDGKKLNGYILICEHPNTGICISEKNFADIGKQISFLNVDFKTKNWFEKSLGFILAIKTVICMQCKKHKKESFYIFNTTYPDFNWINIIRKAFPDKKPVFVVIDEGSGSYLFMSVGAWVSTHVKGEMIGIKRTLDKTILYILGFCRILPRMFLTEYFFKTNGYFDNRLLQKSNGGKLIPNKSIAKYYVDVFEKFRNKDKISSQVIYKEKVLLNTQCLSEDGYLEADQDIEVYDTFFKVASKLGIEVVLKYHPREKKINRYDKYSCTLDYRKSTSQEILVGSNDKPIAAVGIYTSSLVTLKTLYDVPAISLAKLFLNLAISPELKNLLKTFIKIYDGLVIFPENEEELNSVLLSIICSQ